ncbi:MAG TPA: hypothetical protein DHV36_17500 [Desulfobacteraceae bacterium]|nr:hypothetical protein [Desulfobacteraceae bacterium]|tara:strand:+ start:552 stop:1550 length:999 start_codon:yes stop_codon:yes gene_type:complete
MSPIRVALIFIILIGTFFLPHAIPIQCNTAWADRANPNGIVSFDQLTLEEKQTKVRRTADTQAGQWVQKSQDAVTRNDWIETIRTASLAISLDPGRFVAYQNRAWAYCHKGLFYKAMEDAKTALFIRPESPFPYISLAWAQIETQNPTAAPKLLHNALEFDPENPFAFNYLGLAYQKMNTPAKAREYYEKACQAGLQTGCDNYRQMTGVTSLDIRSRVIHFTRIIEKKFGEQKWDDIIALADEIIRIDPKNHTIYATLGGVYAYKGMYDQALINCQKAIELNPDFGLSYNNRGYTYERMGKPAEAKLDYEISCNLGDPYGCRNVQRLEGSPQ